MNERFEFPFEVDPVLLDRLVDGELGSDEERAFIGSLDARPDGWRRCALAFIEARAWRGELGLIARNRTPAHNGVPVHLTLDRPFEGQQTQPSQRRNWPQTLAIAAGLMFAFVLGLATRGNLPFSSSSHERIAQPARQGVGSASTAELDGAGPIQDSWADGLNYAGSNRPVSITMAVVDSNGNTKREIEVPLTETDQIDPSWLASRPAAMPEQLVEALRKSGARVDQQRLYVPVMLEDGRQAILPVDQAEVKFPGLPF
jgi:hypothetical protein